MGRGPFGLALPGERGMSMKPDSVEKKVRDWLQRVQ